MSAYRPRRTRSDATIEMPPLVTAEELIGANDLPQRDTILDPILTSKSIGLLYGPRGLGKTFVALGIAWAAASGGSFLNWHASRPHRVLYIDGEMAAVDLKARLNLLGSAPPTLTFLVADLAPNALPDFGYVEGQSRLVEVWDNPELIVFDNLASLAGFKTGNPDCWNELQYFLMIQRRHGRAVLMVHHANKQGLQRGTNRREDILDLVMAIRRPADYQPSEGARFEIHYEKARGLYGDAARPFEARLQLDNVGVARWESRPVDATELDRLARLLKLGLNPAQAGQELGISRSRSYRLRDQAVRMGLVSG
jgi:AAA domain